MEDDLGELIQHDLLAEQACLGTMLLDPEAMKTCLAIVKPDDFWYSQHQTICRAIVELAESGEDEVDFVGVAGVLRNKGNLDDIGGADYLKTLLDAVATTDHAQRYARRVLECSRIRKLVTLGERLHEKVEQESVDAVLDWLRDNCDKLSQNAGIADARPAADYCADAWEHIYQTADEYRRTGGQPRGVVFGLGGRSTGLDTLFRGLKPPALVAVLAREGYGKTTLMLQAVVFSTIRPVKGAIPALIISLEMPVRKQLLVKLACMTACLRKDDVIHGKVDGKAQEKLSIAMDKINHAPLYLAESAGYNIRDVEREIRNAVRNYGVKFVVLDYLQVLRPLNNEPMWIELQGAARRLLEIAHELDIVLMVGSQQTVSGEFTQVKGSRGLDESADIVIQIKRGKPGATEEEQYRATEGSFLIRKDRMGGAAGLIDAYIFDKARDRYWSFEDWQNEQLRPRQQYQPKEG